MISFAPMEGIGTCYYRRIHHRFFPEGMDRFYTPFLSVHPYLAFRKRDLREIVPKDTDTDEDREIRRMTVPQILAKNSREIVWAVRKLSGYGFKEINLNLGCPSGTVVKKGGGAGMLADKDRLDRTLDEVFSDENFAGTGAALSVKTRLGIGEVEEFHEILSIFNRYPVKEVIVHPRLLCEQYRGRPHRDVFSWALEHSRIPLAYNGDLFTASDIASFRDEFPEVGHIMLGRGIVSDPALIREASGGQKITLSELKGFVDAITAEYTAILDNDAQLLLKLKELWFYMSALFVTKDGGDPARYTRKLLSARSMEDYRNALRNLYGSCELGGHFTGTP